MPHQLRAEKVVGGHLSPRPHRSPQTVTAAQAARMNFLLKCGRSEPPVARWQHAAHWHWHCDGDSVLYRNQLRSCLVHLGQDRRVVREGRPHGTLKSRSRSSVRERTRRSLTGAQSRHRERSHHRNGGKLRGDQPQGQRPCPEASRRLAAERGRRDAAVDRRSSPRIGPGTRSRHFRALPPH